MTIGKVDGGQPTFDRNITIGSGRGRTGKPTAMGIFTQNPTGKAAETKQALRNSFKANQENFATIGRQESSTRLKFDDDTQSPRSELEEADTEILESEELQSDEIDVGGFVNKFEEDSPRRERADAVRNRPPPPTTKPMEAGKTNVVEHSVKATPPDLGKKIKKTAREFFKTIGRKTAQAPSQVARSIPKETAGGSLASIVKLTQSDPVKGAEEFLKACGNMKDAEKNEFINRLIDSFEDPKDAANLAIELAKIDIGTAAKTGAMPLRLSTPGTAFMTALNFKLLTPELQKPLAGLFAKIPQDRPFDISNPQDKKLVSDVFEMTKNVVKSDTVEMNLFKEICSAVKDAVSQNNKSNVDPQSIGADLLFLRVINPAITVPAKLGLPEHAKGTKYPNELGGMIQKIFAGTEFITSQAGAEAKNAFIKENRAELLQPVISALYEGPEST